MGWGEKRAGMLMHVNIDMCVLKGVCVGVVNNMCMFILVVVCVFMYSGWVYYLHACRDLE